MNSKIPFFCFSILTTFCSAQNIVKLTGTKLPIVCYADYIEGNHTHNHEPAAFRNRKSSGRIKTSTFIVEYIGFTPEAQAAFDHAVSIWESLISSPRPIRVAAVWTNLPTGVLGSAGPSFWSSNFKGAPNYNVYYPGALAEKLADQELNGSNEYEIVTQFNSSTNWYFQTTGTPAVGQHDFITVVLHELGHGLGFTSTFEMNNAMGAYGEFTNGIPFPFDLMIENGSTQNLYQNFNSPSTEMGNQLVSGNLFIRTTFGNTLAKLYAPNVFNDGSSIAHLDASAFPQGSPNSLMRPFINTREVNHDPGLIVKNVFASMGWVFTTYIDHDHLKDRENVSLPIEFKAVIKTDGSDGYTFANNNVVLTYSVNGSAAVEAIMMATGTPDEYAFTLPAPNAPKIYSYTIKITDSFGRVVKSPGEIYQPTQLVPNKGPQNTTYSFSVGADNVAPLIVHTPKTFLSYLDNDFSIDAEIIESSGLAEVSVEYSINNGSSQVAPLELIGSSNDVFTGSTTYQYRKIISFGAGQLQDGDEIKYKIMAKDNAAAKNVAIDPVTDYYRIPVIGLAPTQVYYLNNFNTPSADFIGNNFSVTTPSGFSNPAIHSVHPYPEAGANNSLDFTYQLRVPISLSKISEISFDEIVLVEPGEPGSPFGSEDFYDYVIVEGSNDGGATWLPLQDGYDSRDYAPWQARYENATFSDGDPLLFRRRDINILHTFNVGDEVVFRFRLHSDPFGNGWGWAIDNVKIQVDDAAPTILHNHIDYVMENTMPVSIPVKLHDERKLQKVIFDHKINGQLQPSQTVDVTGTDAIVEFALDFANLKSGDSVAYRFQVLDSAGNVSLMPANLPYFNVEVIDFNTVVDSYANDFTISATDFVGNFFTLTKPDRFSNNAIHTIHPYPIGFGFENETEFTFTLKKKINIREENPYVQFDEIAIVEDHPAEAIFGTPAFKDYVVVEASKDEGLSWLALEDGYDAKRENAWLNVLPQSSVVSSAKYKRHTINLLDNGSFSDGDNIVLRFRLFSDASIHAWGWAIDKLHVQDVVTSTEDDLINQIMVYPNPVHENDLTIDYGNTMPKSIAIQNGLGQTMTQVNVDGNVLGNKIKIPLGNFPNGMYLVRLNFATQSIIKKVVVAR